MSACRFRIPKAPFLAALAALLVATSGTARAGIILLPEDVRPAVCRALLVPPSAISRALGAFVSDASVELLTKPGLVAHGSAALELMNALDHGALHVKLVDKPTTELKLIVVEGKVVGVELSLTAANRLLGATNANLGRIVVASTNSNAPAESALSAQLLEELIALERARHPEQNDWDALETADRARYAFKHGSPENFRPDTEAMARSLWRIVGKARETDEFASVAKAFAPGRVDEILSGDHEPQTVGYARDLIAAFLAAGDARVVFNELGIRAASVEAVRQRLATAKPATEALQSLYLSLRKAYDEIYAVAAAKYETRILLINP